MILDREQVQKVAALAQLEFTDDELNQLAGELSGLLSLMDQLREVDTTALDAASAEPACPLREDQPQPSLPREQLLAGAPTAAGQYFLVPRAR